MDKLNKLFEKFVSNEVVTEEAKKELSVVFEAVVNEKVAERVSEEKAKITAQYDEKFDMVVEEHNTQVKTHLNDYLKHCASEFVAENKVAIQNSIVVEKAKLIIDGIQRVFEAHGIKLPESNTQLVEEMNHKNESLKAEYNKAVNKNIELETALEETEKAILFIRKTADMSEVSKAKLMNLMSGLVVESVSDFGKKLEILKNTLVTEKKGKKKVTKEEDEEDKEKKDDEEKVDEEDEDEEKKEDDVEDKVEEDEDEDEKKKEDSAVKEEKDKVSGYLRRLNKVRV